MSRTRKWIVVALGVLMTCGSLGCAHVRPHEREYLADRIMDPAASRNERSSDRKWMGTREGAMGGALGAGGGCACN